MRKISLDPREIHVRFTIEIGKLSLSFLFSVGNERNDMKSKKSIAAGIICGIACAASITLYTNDVQAQASAAREEMLTRYGGEQVEVCVATKDIVPGEHLNSQNTLVKLWVSDLLPDEAVRSLDEVSGMEATSYIVAGEVISKKRFERSDTAIEAPSGTNAISVPAKDVQTVGGSLVPGMKVDIYGVGATATELLAQSVLILSTNVSQAADSSGSISWVTLAVKKESVEEILTASQKTDLYFVLPGQSGEVGVQ